MDATQFYQTIKGKSTRLMLMTQEACEKAALPTQASIQGFSGKLGELVFLSHAQGLDEIWVGAGKSQEEEALAIAATKLPEGAYHLDAAVSSRGMCLWALAQYRFDRFKKNSAPIRALYLDERAYPSLLNEVAALFLIRDLINTPAQQMGPAGLEAEAQGLCKTWGAKLEVVKAEMLKAEYPAIEAVGRAAAEPPRLLCLKWGNPKHRRLSVVGKGVCFDTGGLNLKPTSGIRLMKKDMGGAAHALGLAQWIMSEALPLYLEVYVPAVENAVGPGAYRPGDIIRMRNQSTVEIDNTDAEGRLVMADAITKACENHPDLLIDFSTLTGAARIAVGTDIAALFSNDKALSTDLMKASEAMQDPIWPLPLHEAYLPMLDSNIADLTNSASSSYGGAITAALFLQHFVAPAVRWAHFDMMAWNMSSKPGRPEGGEAMAVRAVMAYLRQWAQQRFDAAAP